MEQIRTKPIDPPVMRGNPIFGSLLDMSRDRLQFVRRLAVLGPVTRFRMGTFYVYNVSTPEGVQRILQDNHPNYFRGRLFDPIRSMIGNGLIVSNGDFWLRQRRLMQPAFHQRRLAALVEGMAAETEITLARWSQAASNSQPLNLLNETTTLAMRIVTRALFSAGLNGAEKRLSEAITGVLEAVSYRYDVPFYPPLSVPTPRNRRTLAAQHVIDQELFSIINSRRSAAGQPDDLLAMLMEARDETTGQGMDDHQLRDEALTMFAAGHETTATTLAWAFWLLSLHPEVLENLRSELDRVLGGRAPSAADIPDLIYTRMVIEETLRLYPAAFITNRQALAEDEISGMRIPAGAIVSISPYGVQHDRRFWDNPEDFDPERFSPARSAGRPRFAYFPFGGGPHQCIGKDFAVIEAAVVLAMAAQRFEWELVSGARVLPRPRITLRPNAVPMLIKERVKNA